MYYKQQQQRQQKQQAHSNDTNGSVTLPVCLSDCLSVGQVRLPVCASASNHVLTTLTHTVAHTHSNAHKHSVADTQARHLRVHIEIL